MRIEEIKITQDPERILVELEQESEERRGFNLRVVFDPDDYPRAKQAIEQLKESLRQPVQDQLLDLQEFVAPEAVKRQELQELRAQLVRMRLLDRQKIGASVLNANQMLQYGGFRFVTNGDVLALLEEIVRDGA